MARRVNAAVSLLAQGCDIAAAARRLARGQGLSERQARRYVERARDGGRVPVPDTQVVFTVKLAARTARAVRRYARRTGGTLSAVVVDALAAVSARREAGARGGGARGGDRVRL
jgi:hypothetical protein